MLYATLFHRTKGTGTFYVGRRGPAAVEMAQGSRGGTGGEDVKTWDETSTERGQDWGVWSFGPILSTAVL